MPTYSYHCDTGNHDFDIVQRFSDDALTVCPECGGNVRRVIQPVGVVFKGSGWYINDSRKTSERGTDARAKTAETSDSPGEKPKDKASEKPAASEKATASVEKSTAKAAD